MICLLNQLHGDKGALLLPKASRMCFFQLLPFSLFCCIAIIPVYRFIRSITVLTRTTTSHFEHISFTTIFKPLQISFTKITDNISYTCGNRWLDYRKSITQLLTLGRSQLNSVHSGDIVFITLVPGFNHTITKHVAREGSDTSEISYAVPEIDLEIMKSKAC